MRWKDSVGDKLRYNLGRRKAKMEIPVQVVPIRGGFCQNAAVVMGAVYMDNCISLK
jgi:hypothetical protein